MRRALDSDDEYGVLEMDDLYNHQESGECTGPEHRTRNRQHTYDRKKRERDREMEEALDQVKDGYSVSEICT